MSEEIEKVIRVPYTNGRTNLIEKFTLDDLNRISSPIIDRAMIPIDEAMEKAGLTAEDLDLVILAGGSSQLPGVRTKIREKLGIEPRLLPKDLMLAVAYGAALYTRQDVANLPKTRIIRTLGFSLGILVDEGGRRVPKLLFNHSQKIPADNTYRFDLEQGQRDVTINLVQMQGDSDRIQKELKKRTIHLKNDASQIEIQVHVSENRLIEVTAYDPRHRDSQETITVDSSALSEDKMREKRKALGIEVPIDTVRNGLQPCIGIDLGTTTSELAYIGRTGDAQLHVLNNEDRPPEYSEYCFPSVVYFKEGEEHPEIANIEACNALNNAGEAGRVISEFKIMDRRSYAIRVDKKPYSVEDLSALLLHKIWTSARKAFPNFDLKDAVVTVPAAYDFDELQETYDAARTAGIENVTLLDEPSAAYRYYTYIQDIDTDRIQNVLVFDFGGGTADVAVLDVKNHSYHEFEHMESLTTVLGVAGEMDCGGRKINDAIVDEIKRRFEEKNHCTIAPRSLVRLRAEVERAKVDISDEFNSLDDED